MLTWRELRGLIITLTSGEAHHASDKSIKAVLSAILSRDSDAVCVASQGLLEQTVMVDRVPMSRLRAMEDKRWWYALAAEENIPIPPILRECDNGRVVSHAPLDPDTMYILKPHNGMGGRGVELRKGNDLPPCTKDYVVQKRLVDCNVNVVRHFRVVTLFDGTVFAIYDLRSRRRTAVVSNGGTQQLCERNQCSDMNPASITALNRLVTKLSEVHGRRMSDIVSVGWDVMLDCDTLNSRVDAYVLEGNIFHSALFEGSLVTAYKRHVDRYVARR